jgi:Protein of unknown function (DUF3551)
LASTTIFRRAIAIAALLTALLVALFGAVSPGRAAAGSEAWCIVTDEGDQHCNYTSSQECLAAIASGNRGFCNVNSSASPPATAAPVRGKKRG